MNNVIYLKALNTILCLWYPFSVLLRQNPANSGCFNSCLPCLSYSLCLLIPVRVQTLLTWISGILRLRQTWPWEKKGSWSCYIYIQEISDLIRFILMRWPAMETQVDVPEQLFGIHMYGAEFLHSEEQNCTATETQTPNNPSTFPSAALQNPPVELAFQKCTCSELHNTRSELASLNANT